jgi:hypothetical protein
MAITGLTTGWENVIVSVPVVERPVSPMMLSGLGAFPTVPPA